MTIKSEEIMLYIFLFFEGLISISRSAVAISCMGHFKTEISTNIEREEAKYKFNINFEEMLFRNEKKEMLPVVPLFFKFFRCLLSA